jgi:hypothetical protein
MAESPMLLGGAKSGSLISRWINIFSRGFQFSSTDENLEGALGPQPGHPLGESTMMFIDAH